MCKRETCTQTYIEALLLIGTNQKYFYAISMDKQTEVGHTVDCTQHEKKYPDTCLILVTLQWQGWHESCDVALYCKSNR